MSRAVRRRPDPAQAQAIPSIERCVGSVVVGLRVCQMWPVLEKVVGGLFFFFFLSQLHWRDGSLVVRQALGGSPRRASDGWSEERFGAVQTRAC